MKSKREVLNSTKKNKRNQYSTLETSSNLKSISFSSPKTEFFRSFSNTYTNPQEEAIEIKIPTPYPMTQYMLIEDPNLINSRYTEILNEKYPPRKFLKHNLTSWNKCNKNKQTKDINVKFMNPKIKFEDFNLKKLTYKGEDVENENIRNLDDAFHIIEMLKTKIIEYELTNNENIETSINHINNLKYENEFFKNKIVENYEKLNYVAEKFDIDNIDDFMYDSKNLLKRILRKYQILSFVEHLKKILDSRHKSKRIQSILKKFTHRLKDFQKKNDKISFFRKSKIQIKQRKRDLLLINLFKRNKFITNNFNHFRTICLFRKIRKDKLQYDKIIQDIRVIIEEKNEVIKNLEFEYKDTNSVFSKVYNETINLNQDNEILRKRIVVLESKIENDNLKFRELWNINVNDIKHLQSTLQTNESLLSEAIRREEKLQHKYCVDIENAIKLNKQLNSIISKKNKTLADLKIKQQKTDEDKVNENKKLYKENASLFNDYAKIIELKEKEKRYNDEDKIKMMEKAKNKIEQLEGEKIKSDFKVRVLENENKGIFNELISEIKKKK